MFKVGELVQVTVRRPRFQTVKQTVGVITRIIHPHADVAKRFYQVRTATGQIWVGREFDLSTDPCPHGLCERF